MKKGILFFAIVFICNSNIQAQQFIDKATIEFEVKTNVKKTMGNGMWADLLKDMPQYKTGYFNFSFSPVVKLINTFATAERKIKITGFILRHIF